MKYSFEEVKSKFEERGYTLLSDESEYKSVNSKLRYLCPIHGEKRNNFCAFKRRQRVP